VRVTGAQTTGLDPVSRRRVWNLIENLKKDRVVLLTTHSMEEVRPSVLNDN
jgi:ABC-type multidrug transport system ATPase subunit